MSSRRILILTNRVPYPVSDGGNLAMKVMIEGYRDEGWDVCLLTMNTTRHYVEPGIVRDAYPGIRVELVDVNNDVKPLPTILNYLLGSLPNHAVRFRKPEFREKLNALMADFAPDVVQWESVFLSEYLPDVRKSKAFLILRMHNVEGEVWERVARENRSFFKSLYLANLAERIRKYEHRVWAQFDLLLAITEVDAAVAKNYNRNTLTIPFGIDTTQITPNKATGEWRLYHIGAMDWLPNAEAVSWFLDEVWPSIHQQHSGLKFHFAGRKMPVSFSDLKIPGVICAGEVPDADHFISDKNILVVPLRSGGGLRVKILEAMAAGKLVISTTIGMQGIEAIAGKHYLQANNPAEFAAAIDRVCADPVMGSLIASSGQEFAAKNFDRHAIMQRLLSTVEDMLKNRPM